VSSSSSEREALWRLPVDEKLWHAKEVAAQALRKAQHPVVLYTGGKDSTVLLWVVRGADPRGREVPALLIDHGLHFPETWKFIDLVKAEWTLHLMIARNEDVLSHAQTVGAPVRVRDLNKENQREVREVLGYPEETFPYTLNTQVGNHLLKTVALKQAVRTHGFDWVFVGIRWDEHPARAQAQFTTPQHDPAHTRVHPILPLTERDIWTVMIREKLPTHPLYAQGYRSLDSVEAARRDHRPAWEQELGVGERAGREQDKEGLMERLRALGYM
jgi:phosphoadenosine phosphosulfate reductase